MSAPTVLLTLGRLPKGLDLAWSFAAAGWRVVVADPFAWHLCRVSRAVARSRRTPAPTAGKARYLDAIAAIAEDEDAALIVPISEETLYVAELAGALPRARVATMPADRLIGLHDKHAFNVAARSYGLAAPETYRAGERDADGFAARGGVVIKPIYSCSGRGVRLHPGSQPAPPPRPDEAAIVQAYVEGEAQSSFSLTHEGRVLASVVYRGVVMSGTVAVCFERVDAPAIETWVETFVARNGCSGFMSFDFIVDAEGTAWAIECNPRLTSGVHFIATQDLARAVAEPETAGPIALRPERRLQQFYPVLTEAQSPFFWRPAFKKNAKYLFTTPEVSWSRRDPLPFALLPFVSYEILGKSMFQSMSFGEAATADIEWRAEEA